jgi:peptidoglycan/LPS O-acetylase OafA/YrhL
MMPQTSPSAAFPPPSHLPREDDNMSVGSVVGSATEAKVAEPRSWLSKLSRVTTSGRFVAEIDGFRFLAITSVFLGHDLGQVLAKNGVGVDAQRGLQLDSLHGMDWLFATLVFSCCAFGVQLFFVISGFILGLPFAEHHLLGRRKPALKAYFLRRVTRLEPPYLLNLIILAIVLHLHYHWQHGYTLRHLLASTLYLHSQIFNDMSTINGVAWSLEVEVQFYVLAPLLALLFMVRNVTARRALLTTLVIGIAVLNNLLAPPVLRYQGSLAFAIQYFLAGFLLADVYLVNPDFLKQRHLLWDGVCAILALTMAWSLMIGGGPWGSLTFHLPFCIFLFYLAAFKSVILRRILTSPPIFLIGGMCYTIYLYHGLMASVLALMTRKIYIHSLPLVVNYTIQFSIHATAVLTICIVLFKLIERPCMKRDWPQQLACFVSKRFKKSAD